MLADLRICVPGGCAEWCLAPLVGGGEHVGVPRCLAPSAVNGARHAQTRRALVLHRGEPGTYPRSPQAPVREPGTYPRSPQAPVREPGTGTLASVATTLRKWRTAAMSSARSYVRSVWDQTRYVAAWIPITKVELGEIYKVHKGVPQLVGTLADWGIEWKEDPES